MQLEISSLKENKGKSVEFEFEENMASLELGGGLISFNKPVFVGGTATNVESGILVECEIKAELIVNCDRCLRPVNVNVETNVTEEFIEVKNAGFYGNNGEKDYTYKGSIIDISDFVEENILVNVPMKNLCSTECKGICSTCGVDRNVVDCECSQQDTDPRMEKLKAWFKE